LTRHGVKPTLGEVGGESGQRSVPARSGDGPGNRESLRALPPDGALPGGCLLALLAALCWGLSAALAALDRWAHGPRSP
jgi:hypothetical protein